MEEPLAEKPNILFVFADQWRYSALGANGNPDVCTPNLDRLAEHGVVFDNAFSGRVNATPGRGCSSLVSGSTTSAGIGG